jgi:hypothetical protein
MATNQTWRFTIAQRDGRPLCTLLVSRERPEPAERRTQVPRPPTPPGLTGNGAAPAQEPEPRMTEPQRRYLFRLLAAQGVEAKSVEAHLRDLLKVGSLRAVSRTAASQLIEQLLADPQEATDDNA